MNKVWKPVIGFENYFLVSSCGSIFSLRTNKELKLSKTKSGYTTLSTKVLGKAYLFRVHRLVAQAFIYDDKFNEVNHIDGDKSNNDVSNLEWVSRKENTIHAYKLGLMPCKKGSNNPNSKLTSEDRLNIKEEYKKGNTSYRKLGIKYNVNKSTIRDVILSGC